jgi:integrase
VDYFYSALDTPVHAQPEPYIPVYPDHHGEQRRRKPAVKRAEIAKGIGWHSLRHTYSTLLRANKADIKVQQELLRHANVQTTLQIYTQAVSEQKRQANARVVGQLMAAASA